ncbi:MAG: peptidase M22 [Clostridia bacterium]|nr:peptidase M22 [Clostridia bacterium]
MKLTTDQKPRNPIVLAIDTSNYTTSAACSTPDSGYVSGGFLVCQEKEPLRVKEGERGLRQSDALFAHTVNLPTVIERLLSQIPENAQIAAIGYSSTPRRIEGSYMPCFLAGEAVARSLSAAMKVPLYAFSHQEGHIAAAAYSAQYDLMTENSDTNPILSDVSVFCSPFLAFHVSGGTTDVLHVVPKDGRYEITQLGTSLDLHAGQAVDRIGVMLGLSFPCGPALEMLAKQYQGKIESPRVSVIGCDCNLSGLENMAKKRLNQGASHEEIAAFTFVFLEKTLKKMTENALMQYPHLPVLYSGGVMSNTYMRHGLRSLCRANRSKAYFAAPQFSSDNAVGISMLTCRAYSYDKENT